FEAVNPSHSKKSENPLPYTSKFANSRCPKLRYLITPKFSKGTRSCICPSEKQSSSDAASLTMTFFPFSFPFSTKVPPNSAALSISDTLYGNGKPKPQDYRPESSKQSIRRDEAAPYSS
ncbi:hypothetical protein RJ640_021817, partial [Escallonia rubra]